MTLRDARNPNDAKPPKRKNKHNNKNKCGEERRKTKLCWFHLNHPHGCLFSADNCNYAHDEEQLRDVKPC